MATIWSTMLGNTPVLRMEKLSCWPVDTSSLIWLTAFTYTELPVAPATDPRASTRGTPAAKVVESVRQ